jgi:hypothetical protein
MNEMLEFIIMLTSDGKKLNILMPVLVLPFINSVLRNLAFGTTHFNLIFFSIGILLMLIVVLKAVDEPWTVRLRWLSHKCVDNSVLDLDVIFFIVLEQKRVLENFIEYLVSCNAFEKPMAVRLGFMKSVCLKIGLLHYLLVFQ